MSAATLTAPSSPPASLDEPSLRRPAFRPGREVVMADGQAWNLPLPFITLVAADTEAGYEVRLTLEGEDRFGAAYAAYEAATDFRAILKAEFGMAKALILANYDLSAEQLARVLQFGLNDRFPEGVRIREQVRAIALGSDGPKPEAGGDESSDSPPA